MGDPDIAAQTFSANGRSYTPPSRPIAVICIDGCADFLNGVDGITEVYDRAGLCRRLELAEDRIGDICVLCGRDFVLGPPRRSRSVGAQGWPAFSRWTLRGDGADVALTPSQSGYKQKALGDPRNFDIFDFACNGMET